MNQWDMFEYADRSKKEFTPYNIVHMKWAFLYAIKNISQGVKPAPIVLEYWNGEFDNNNFDVVGRGFDLVERL